MAKSGNNKLMSQAVRLGLAYGPVVFAAAKKAGITPETVLSKQMEKTDARKHALEHAHHLIDGSVLTVFEGDKRIFVVFTGDKPIASHPQTKTPLPTLIEGYDLDKRVRSTDRTPRAIALPRPAAWRRRGTSPRKAGSGPQG